MKKIGIFGASSVGKSAYLFLKEKYTILFFIDNSTEKIGKKFCDTLVIAPQNIEKYNYDFIVIASVYYDEILKQLIELRVDDIHIFSKWKKDGEYKFYLNKILDPENVFKISRTNRENVLHNNMKRNFKSGHSKKTVLIIAYFFPPIGGGGTQRTSKFVKYLREYGWEPVVVTVDEDHYYWNDNDYTLLDELPKDIKIIRIKNRVLAWYQLEKVDIQNVFDMYSGILWDVGSKELECFWNDKLRDNRANVMMPDEYALWNYDVIVQIEKILEQEKINVVYTTGSPFSDFYVGYYVKKNHGIPWVMDYRDLWTRNSMLRDKQEHKEYLHIQEEIELQLQRKADKIVTVSEYLKDILMDMDDMMEKDKYICITNGYDEEDFSELVEKEQRNKFTIAYSGLIYSEKEEINAFMTVLEQINELIDNKIIDTNQIQFKIIGNWSKSIEENIESVDKYKVINWISYLAHKEFVTEIYSADLLFVTAPNKQTFDGAYTGKLFEYLRMKGEILAICAPNAIIRELLQETKRGEAFDHIAYIEIRDYIYRYFLLWEREISKGQKDNTAIEKYERKKLTGELAKIFEEIMADKFEKRMGI